MDFIKKHYEKIVLSVVLLSLAVGAALLPLKVSDVRQNLEDTQAGLTVRSKPKLFKPVDLTTNEIVVKRSLNVKPFDFATPHNIFNPVEWRKKPDGGLIKMETGTEAGVGALIVEDISPLHLNVTLDYVSGNDGDYRYHFTVERETERNPRRVVAASMNVPNPYFLLTGVEGAPDAPTAVTLILNGERSPVTVSKENPLTRVIGYAAVLKYPGERTPAKAFKKDDFIKIPRDPDRYKIVAITQDEVVLSASSSEKRTPLKWKSAPRN
ncbi:MAG: hypothetical protein K9N62_06055 [Verrucomicrobia bacterium]|nr:hypothetical protein [Verrucomicrobiota bacterium]